MPTRDRPQSAAIISPLAPAEPPLAAIISPLVPVPVGLTVPEATPSLSSELSRPLPSASETLNRPSRKRVPPSLVIPVRLLTDEEIADREIAGIIKRFGGEDALRKMREASVRAQQKVIRAQTHGQPAQGVVQVQTLGPGTEWLTWEQKNQMDKNMAPKGPHIN